MTTNHSESGDQFLTPLRGLNEFVYCPRLFHLMYVQGLFEESIDTLEGRLAHKRLLKSKATSSHEKGAEKIVPWRSDMVRELVLSSESLRISGKFDAIVSEQGDAVPVEFKHGPAPDGERKFMVGPYQLSSCAWGNDQVQLAGQIALLKEAGHCCHKGKLYYQQTGTLVEIQWNEDLLNALKWAAEQAYELTSSPMPEPLVDSGKCIRCSLNHVCLPDETLHIKGVIDEPRQLYPGRDDYGILHLVTPGTVVGKTGDGLKIMVPDQIDTLIPIKDVAHLCCWGNVQVSTQTVLELADRGISITWLTGGGWLRATTTAPLEKNVYLRRTQYRICDDRKTCLRLARWVVEAKIENQRVLVRRNEKDLSLKDTVRKLRICRERAQNADCLESLRGIEGYAAKLYWGAFPSLLNDKEGSLLQMQGRNRRPPKDPVNALLSYGYAMLLRDFMTALHGTGMDPMYGFYHAVVPGRPSLALDLMEAFRPLVVDSAVLRGINEGSFSKDDFVQAEGFCAMKPNVKKRWIKAYERRVDEMATHPLFGYRLSYRRMFILEARLFGRFVSGELSYYHPMRTR
jgi:CRISPR-associated protein Cas1